MSQKPWPCNEKISIYDYQILPCIDCHRCKKDDFTERPVGWDGGDRSRPEAIRLKEM